LIFKGRVLKDE
jgi:ubiquilin